ncbi:MAG TPA: MMPL family transporter [Rhizomicrobium sp.]|nr:MMPL family transporter [Rhizomicrobium sp.]
MLRTIIVRLVEFSTRFARAVVASGVIIASLCTFYAMQHFSVVTDVRQLFPSDLPWARRASQFMDAFPQYEVLVVVGAPTPELAQKASAELTAALNSDRAHIRTAVQPQGGTFLARNGFLFMSTAQLAHTAAQMERARPLLQILATDPSLRGVLQALSAGIAGVERRAYPPDALTTPLTAGANTVQAALDGRPAWFSWQNLANGETAQRAPVLRFIEVAPVLNFKALQPAKMTTDAIARTASLLGLARHYQASVRITGLAPMNDAQFATLKENAALNAAISVLAVLIILWLALRSWKIIFAVVFNVVCGMAMTAALGLWLVGALNLISVAFFVLFAGLAIDFGIQFSVRYRAERHETGRLDSALSGAAQKAGWSLALAAAATAIGFSSFLPTGYRGLSELGEVAGPGMIIAFLSSITLLPALLKLVDPPAEPGEMAFAALAPIDRFLHRHRYHVLYGTLAVVCLASPLLVFLRFDFNTLHLQNSKSPPVAAYLELRKNPETGANAADLIAPDLATAQADARELAMLPQVGGTRTLANLIPDNQPAKLAIIRRMAMVLAPVLNPPRLRSRPTDEDEIATLESTARQLSQLAKRGGAAGRAAAHLSDLLVKLAYSDPATRAPVSDALVLPLEVSLQDLRYALQPRLVTIADIPSDLKRQWLASDGRARVEILPKGDPEDTSSLAAFVRALLVHHPADITGPAVLLYEAGRTVARAFVEAGLFAIAAIALLLWIALRRLRDVFFTLVPLLLAALLTLELCVIFNVALNFTNIIAFPLLLGVGVAFKIYYIMAWRRGGTALVQSTLTRAVLFSGLTTATAFGTLWMSSNPGTSSMGQLMALALLCTMMAAVLFQPVLMGPPQTVTAPVSPGGRPLSNREEILSPVPIRRG